MRTATGKNNGKEEKTYEDVSPGKKIAFGGATFNLGLASPLLYFGDSRDPLDHENNSNLIEYHYILDLPL